LSLKKITLKPHQTIIVDFQKCKYKYLNPNKITYLRFNHQNKIASIKEI